MITSNTHYHAAINNDNTYNALVAQHGHEAVADALAAYHQEHAEFNDFGELEVPTEDFPTTDDGYTIEEWVTDVLNGNGDDGEDLIPTEEDFTI